MVTKCIHVQLLDKYRAADQDDALVKHRLKLLAPHVLCDALNDYVLKENTEALSTAIHRMCENTIGELVDLEVQCPPMFIMLCGLQTARSAERESRREDISGALDELRQ